MAESQPNASDDLASLAPVTSEALSVDQADDRLTALLGGDPETDLADEADGTTSDADEPAASEPDEDELDPADISEDDDVPADDDNPDEPTYEDGQFVPDGGKVKMPDGRTISVAELKEFADNRVKEFQRDYTQKNQTLAEEKKAVEAKQAEYDQLQAQVQQEREYALWYLEQNAPQEPQRPSLSAAQDPMAWLQYQEDMGKYQTVAQAWQAMHAGKTAEAERAAKQQKEQFDAYVAKERDALFNAVPILKDDTKRQQFFDNTWTGAEKHYGLKAEELNGIADHRLLLVLKDALAFRRAKEKAPTVEKEVRARPTAVQGSGRRPNPEASQRREADGLRKQLRETGSTAAADAYLAKLLG